MAEIYKYDFELFGYEYEDYLGRGKPCQSSVQKWKKLKNIGTFVLTIESKLLVTDLQPTGPEDQIDRQVLDNLSGLN